MRSLISITLAIILTSLHSITNGQIIYTFAGNGISGYSGDGGPAISAQLSGVAGVATDVSGNVYIADYTGHRIRKVNPSGIISTIGGTGNFGYSGDGGPATSAQLNNPSGITVDSSGNIYVCDQTNHRIRKIDIAGIITTIAGNGIAGYSGDGGAATSAKLDSPISVAVDNSGSVYIADLNNNAIRKVSPTGIITTIAGTGAAGYSGDGGPAISAEINSPCGVALDATGNIYVADSQNARLRKINSSGIINTIAGTGTIGFSGDGGLATSAQIGAWGVNVDALNNIYLCDANRMRIINTAGIIATIVGTGTTGHSGDGNLATLAQVSYPAEVAIDASANIYVTDATKVRIICPGSCVAGLNTFKESGSKFLIYPNPNNGAFKLNMDTEIENGEIILIDGLGQKVHEQKIVSGENNISARGLAKGLYNYIILQNKTQQSYGKLMVDY